MKKVLKYSAAFLLAAAAWGCSDGGKPTQETSVMPPAPPYRVVLEEQVNPQLPDLHSYTHATYKDKIIMFGGRTNGLHGGSYDFFREHSNDSIYVVDTHQWNDTVATWTVYRMANNAIPYPHNRHFKVNNAQFFTEDSVLYVVGGLLGAVVHTKLKNPANPQSGIVQITKDTAKAVLDTLGPNTLNYMTAITMPALIDQVMLNKPLPPNAIRRTAPNDSLAVTGGELEVIDKRVYLTFGWEFDANGEAYSHQIRTFTWADNGTTVSISPISVCKTCWDGINGTDTSSLKDSGYFRRRDGSMSALIDPALGPGNPKAQQLLYYSGVFKDGNVNFDTPVRIGQDEAKEDSSFHMRGNVYTCQVIPVYAESAKTFYGTLLGGMDNSTYQGGAISAPTLLTAANAPITSVANQFQTIPFSNKVTTMAMNAGHQFAQYLMPDSFPPYYQKTSVKPNPNDPNQGKDLILSETVYNGSESEMHWLPGNFYYANGVVNYDAFVKANPVGGKVGYLHGGILSMLPAVFSNNTQAKFTMASNRIFAVKIIPAAAKP